MKMFSVRDVGWGEPGEAVWSLQRSFWLLLSQFLSAANRFGLFLPIFVQILSFLLFWPSLSMEKEKVFRFMWQKRRSAPGAGVGARWDQGERNVVINLWYLHSVTTINITPARQQLVPVPVPRPVIGVVVNTNQSLSPRLAQMQSN